MRLPQNNNLKSSNKSVSAFSGNDFQSFQVTANCADVTFKANDTVMYINIKYVYIVVIIQYMSVNI